MPDHRSARHEQALEDSSPRSIGAIRLATPARELEEQSRNNRATIESSTRPAPYLHACATPPSRLLPAPRGSPFRTAPAQVNVCRSPPRLARLGRARVAGCRCAWSYARRSRISARIAATTSDFGFAPRLPLPCTRTLTALAAMSRGPTTSMVWTLASSAC
jgi:hypothetical protein